MEHIRYGRPEASENEVIEAAKLSGAHQFISRMADGYETRIGEKGERLSGGQRQRLDLARALLRHSPILILDEPTSQLDAGSEHQFKLALNRIRLQTSKTIILVGHRLSTVALADQIIVIALQRNFDQFSAGTARTFLH